MRIGAYQFPVTGSIKINREKIVQAIHGANDEKVKLLIFPECSLTGYPPRDVDNPSNVDFDELDDTYFLYKSCVILMKCMLLLEL